MAEKPSKRIANCPNPDCGVPVYSNHPYPWCTGCGERFPESLQARLPRVQETRKKAEVARENLAAAEGPWPAQVLGRPLRCLICGHGKFFHYAVGSNEILVASLLGVDTAKPQGTYFVCADCGYVHWFRR